MMKKLLLLSAILFFAISAFSQSRTAYTAVATGNWSSTSTWNPSGVPVDGDDVTIPSPYNVTVATGSRAASTITVNSGATLTISSGATLTTSGNVVVEGTMDLTGTCTVGNAVTDYLNVNGGTLYLNDAAVLNVAGYYQQNYVDATHVGFLGSTLTNITATMNIATAGPLNDNTNNIFKISDNCEVKFGTSALDNVNVAVNIQNGNSGTAAEIFIGSIPQYYPGVGTTTIGTGSSTVTDWYMTNNSSMGHVKLDIGAANTFHFSHTVSRTTKTIIFFSLTITSGKFQVEPTAGLKISSSNGLSVGASGQLILASDNTGTGELHFSGFNTVAGTSNLYIAGNQWHQITPVTTGVTTADIFQNHSPNVWLMEFNTTTQTFDYIIDPSLTQALNVGQGYDVIGGTLTGSGDNFTITTNGNLRSQDFAVTFTAGTNQHQLIGNPFSTSFNVDNSLTAATDVYGQIWVWDPVNDNYAFHTTGGGGGHSGVVAEGQGFFVEVSGASPALTLASANREFGTPGGFYKKGGLLDWDNNYGKGVYAMIKVSDGKRTDAAFVTFGESGTPGFENGYDGFKMFGNENAPQLYLIENEQQLSLDYIQSLTEESERIVQMNLQPGVTGEHTLAINLDSLPDTKVTLEDLVTGTIHNFNDDPFYTFNASKGDDPARFLLHFNYSPTGIENPGDDTESTLKIYAWDKAVYISNSDNDFAEATINVYDLFGRKLVSTQTRLDNLTRIPVQVNNSYLIVQVIKGSNVVTEKVFVK